jgi:hypothetical protein
MRAVLFAVLVAACSRSDSAPPAPKAAPAEHKDMPIASPALDKFHNLLAPHWHAAKDDKRMPDTCAVIGDFASGADDVAKAVPGDPGKQLVDSVAALKAACDAKDAAAFEAAFQRVHEGFHHAMAATGVGHDEGGGGKG